MLSDSGQADVDIFINKSRIFKFFKKLPDLSTAQGFMIEIVQN